MRKNIVQVVLAGTICAVTIAGCKLPIIIGCRRSAPTRPAGVPETAVWAGGVDGGAFFACTPSVANEANACTVYHDSDGEVYMSGSYVLKGTQRGAKAGELFYSGADGHNIYLDHNLTLVPISSSNAR